MPVKEVARAILIQTAVITIAAQAKRIVLLHQVILTIRTTWCLPINMEPRQRFVLIVGAQTMVIHIRQVATHPDRNQAEVKETKTESSIRDLALAAAVAPSLVRPEEESINAFIFGGDKPWSYTKVKKTCDRIKREIGFDGKITPIRFRTTVLTDIYDATKDIKLTQAMAGHSSSAMTLERYVKGRQTTAQGTEAIERLYS